MRFNLAKIMGDIFSEADEINQELDYFKKYVLPKFKKHEKYKELKVTINSTHKHSLKLNGKILKIITHRFVADDD